MNLSKLRVVLVTPWNTQSAIAAVNLLVVKVLEDRGVGVTIVRCETGAHAKTQGINTELPILSSKDLLRLRSGHDYDVICYAIGDNWPFHGGAIDLLAQRPGIVLLHDASLRNLALGWERDSGGVSCQELLRTLSDHSLPSLATPSVTESESMVVWPMSMATGGVVHAQHYLDLAQKACPGPVVDLSLPVADIAVASARKRLPGDPIIIVTIGHVNSNKLPEEVIRAIASSDRLRTHIHYRLLGPIDDATRSRLAVLAGGLGVNVQMTGWLDEDHLLREIGLSDGVLCLRYPILEGASMSAIVGLLSARPTVVCDAGFYSEIPDELAIKLSACPDTAGIAGALETILDEPDRMTAMAARARVHALDRFTASRYVDGLLDLIERAIDVSFTVSEARRMHAETRAWGLDGSDPLFNRLSNVSAELFS